MPNQYQEFLKKAEVAVNNDALKGKILNHVALHETSFQHGSSQFSNLELARQRASVVKNKVIENLEKFLIEFEANFIKRGGKVIWAQNAEEAVQEIGKIIEKSGAKRILKSKSLVCDEIDLHQSLKRSGHIQETDLGDYVQDSFNEGPFHFVNPALHHNKNEVRDQLQSKAGYEGKSDVQEIASFVRKDLRKKFSDGEIGINGANFLIADPGAIVVVENEGNAALTASFPKVQIVVAGIEKLLPTLSELDLFLPLLSTYGTGQNITAYNSIITGPKQQGENDGPQEMYVVLLDNNRSTLLAEPEQRRALTCIKCGACQNVCPVYQEVGGFTYNATYTGPIGSIITPYLKGVDEYKHLSYASTICGKCTTVCPVNIDLHKLLLYNRNSFSGKGESTKKENWSMYFWKNAMLKRAKMDKGGPTLKNFMLRQFFKKSWGEKREMPTIAPKSFNQIWRERKGLR